VYHIILGSNLGDRKGQIGQAQAELNKRAGTVVSQSRLYETQPWGYADQPWFINQAIALESNLEPLALLGICKAIETELGRQPNEQWHARHIDIDIVLCEATIISHPDLTLPHPRLHERNFVLIPLMEIAAFSVHPVMGKTIEELYFECRDQGEVYIFNADEQHEPL
jgi:2-amino-4-hydroxy-6-hydroxymethyldihydropteridine diphosphokinase